MAAPPEIMTLSLPPNTLYTSLRNFLFRSNPSFLVNLLMAITFFTADSLPCFLMFFHMVLYRASKMAGTPRNMVGRTSLRFFTIYLSPSQ